MFIDPDIYSKKRGQTLQRGGVFKTPLQSLSSYLLRKTREKIFPSSLLSPFKRVYVAFVLLRILCVKIFQSNSIASSGKISFMSGVYICMTTNTQTLQIRLSIIYLISIFMMCLHK